MRTQTHNQIPKTEFFLASNQPIIDLNRVKYEGQDPLRMQYRTGYEGFLNRMPVLNSEDPLLGAEIALSKTIMQNLAATLREEKWVTDEQIPSEGGFNRTILAMESPKMDWSEGIMPKLKEGVELLGAKWGNGHTSPVHGHSAGFIHEDILFGKMRVNTYRITNKAEKKVRPLQTLVAKPGTFASAYLPALETDMHKREKLVHNFTSIGYSASLHYVPEHTRDGRDNTFEVEYFDNFHNVTREDVVRITAQEGMYLRKGDVVLVRSANVPEYGDHYIVVTGHPIMKEHGMRIQDVVLPAVGSLLLDYVPVDEKLVLLKLKPNMRDKFLAFHGIKLEKDEVIFPEPIVKEKGVSHE